MIKTIAVLIITLCVCAEKSFAKKENALTLVASSETHAMLFPCDCPVNPGGGMAKRAHALAELGDSAALLLVDAGGFSGGGMYDSYTEGRKQDSLRTIATIKAMAAMHYDAAAIGDDDLQYGAAWLMRIAVENKLPLVSANCESADHSAVGQRYVLVKKGSVTFAITGLTTQEKLFSVDKAIIINPPLQALRKIWPEMKKKSDFQIILAHLGEEASSMIQDSFPDCAVVVNGHRKTSTEAVLEKKGRLLMEFGFEGKSLSFAELSIDKRSLVAGKTGWLEIPAETPDEATVLGLVQKTLADTLSSNAGANRSSVFDLYIMSQCPYGLNALREFTAFLGSFQSTEWHIGFIGTILSDSTLSSLHGNKEVEDEMLWLAVQSLHPKQWLGFLGERAQFPKMTSEASVLKMGMDLSPIKKWAKEKGKAELSMYYARSTRLGITASPTLLVNNVPAEMEITKPRLAKTICLGAKKLSAYCDSVPDCIDNSDCKKKGMDGVCEQISGKAHCEFSSAPPFAFTVLLPDSQLMHPEAEVIGTTKDIFTGAVIETVFVLSNKGKQLVSDFSPQALPFYLFDRKVAQNVNFAKIEAGLELKKNGYVFKNDYVKNTYFYKRPLMPRACVVFIDPLFSAVKNALAIALAKHAGVNVRIEPIITTHPDASKLSGEDQLRKDEAERWLLLEEKYGKNYQGYLTAYLKKNAASYWFLTMRELGVNVDDFVKNIASDHKRLNRQWDVLSQLGIVGPVEVLINNREVVAIKSPKELGEVLDRVK